MSRNYRDLELRDADFYRYELGVDLALNRSAVSIDCDRKVVTYTGEKICLQDSLADADALGEDGGEREATRCVGCTCAAKGDDSTPDDKAKAADAPSKQVNVEENAHTHTLAFDKCLICTGGRARDGSTPGVFKRNGHLAMPLRTAADADRIQTATNTLKKVVIAGAGFI
ncbi:unnamed protein product, partial [Amoebophrya sp. A25]|eukprot:GSA25T00017293001.1